jgi:hypothetical protein
MNRKFLISWLVIFVLWMAGSFVVHGLLLADAYGAQPDLYRPQSELSQYYPFMLLAHVIFAAALVWIYQRGNEARPWLAQGLRFGLAIALLTAVPTYLIYYVVQPLPGNMVVMQIAYESILLLVLGVVIAYLNRSGAAG